MVLYVATLIAKFGVVFISGDNVIGYTMFIFPVAEISAPFFIMYHTAKNIIPDTKNILLNSGKIALIIVFCVVWTFNSVYLFFVLYTLGSIMTSSNINILIFPITSFIYWFEVIHIWKPSMLSAKTKYFLLASYVIGIILFICGCNSDI